MVGTVCQELLIPNAGNIVNQYWSSSSSKSSIVEWNSSCKYNQIYINHTLNLSEVILTNHRISQLPTDHSSITAVPGVITDGTPESTETNLHCSFSQTTS